MDTSVSDLHHLVRITPSPPSKHHLPTPPRPLLPRTMASTSTSLQPTTSTRPPKQTSPSPSLRPRNNNLPHHHPHLADRHVQTKSTRTSPTCSQASIRAMAWTRSEMLGSCGTVGRMRVGWSRRRRVHRTARTIRLQLSSSSRTRSNRSSRSNAPTLLHQPTLNVPQFSLLSPIPSTR